MIVKQSKMSETDGLTRSLATFVATLDPKTLPEDARTIATAGFIDCVAVLFAGWDAPAARHMRSVANVADWTDPLARAGLTGEDDALHLAVATDEDCGRESQHPIQHRQGCGGLLLVCRPPR